MLERADREGMPAYHEATTPRNRALYERHGYVNHGEFTLPDDGPTLWRMWRDPLLVDSTPRTLSPNGFRPPGEPTPDGDGGSRRRGVGMLPVLLQGDP